MDRSQDHTGQDQAPGEGEPGEGEPGSVVGAIEQAALAAILRAGTLDELDAVVVDATGKRSSLADLQRQLSERSAGSRPAWGKALQQARRTLGEAAERRRTELAAAQRAERSVAERMDLTEVLPAPLPGQLHPVTQTWEELEDIFTGMGFVVAEGPEVEDDWHNFTALNMPANHPARDGQDSFYLEMGEPESVLLRTQTSPVQIRLMESQPPPIWAVSPGRVYRRDTPDASHLAAFHQIEALVVDRGISFAHLAGTISTFTKAFFGPSVRSRLRPAYFPFTEPSAEFDISCTLCGGDGCRSCGGVGWLELGGSGMVDPAVFQAVGLDPEEWSGFAFGFGIDRCAAMRWGIPDIRLLVDNDARFLSQF
ncbi:MAG: phenylalanine--tRNA ligase subunit alpha [Actinomycetota bacterium]|nr:phenylalanine--tRNA ligase subunit alpha [Actinomycetota bacterium]